MAPDSPHSSRSATSKSGDASKLLQAKFKPKARSVEVEGEATDTFSFNVSAAEAADLEQKTRVDTGSGTSSPTRPLRFSRTPSTLAGSDWTSADREVSSGQGPFIRVVQPAKKRQKMPSWAASLMLHALLLLPFGLLTQAEQEIPVDNSLLVSFEPSEQLDQIEILEDLEFDPIDQLDTVDVELASDVPDPGISGLTDLSADSALAEFSDEMATHSDSLGDLGTLFDERHQGLSDLGENLDGAPLADFFGTKVEGNRIVYVLDNSGGMVSGELETLIAELLRSVESLTPKQQFYVIFYSDALYPLFYPNAPQHFVLATDENKRLLEEWLDTVELCVGNVVDEALAAATAIRPDAVYLLTDGDLDSTRDQRRIRFLLDSSGRSFPIHTFGLGTGSESKAALKLKQVAEANGGLFRAVEVEPEAVALAKIKARPYHNKSPGEVWGLRVGKWSR